MVSLIRATDASLLRKGPEGYTVDFAGIEKKSLLNEDERLLLKLRNALDVPGDPAPHSLALSWSEGLRLAETLGRLENLGPWDADVVEMSQRLRARLAGLTESAR